MKPIRGELISKAALSDYVRNRFFEIVSYVESQALKELSGEPFQLFIQANMQRTLNPLLDTQFDWRDFERGTDKCSPQQKKLRDGLIAWLDRWHLIESANGEKWCLRWLVYAVLDHWAHSADLVREHSIVGEIRRTQKLPKTSASSGNLPAYTPAHESREEYFNRVSETARQHIASDPILASAEQSHRESFIRAVVDGLSDYCQQVEAAYFEEDWKQVAEKRKLTKHLIWTIQFQLQEKSYSQIARAEKIEVSTVKRAVDETLIILGLQRRRNVRRGRPPHGQNSYASQLLKELGN